MARRKKDYLSDGSSDSGASEVEEGYDSQEDPDARAERELFEHGGRRKKRRVGDGKSDAWEGIFGEDEEEPDRRGSRGGRAGGPSRGSAKFTSAPKFVSSHNTPTAASPEGAVPSAQPSPTLTAEPSAGSDMEIDDDGASAASSDDESKRRRSPRVKESTSSDEDEAPQVGRGIGPGIGLQGGRGGAGIGMGGGGGGIGMRRGGAGIGGGAATSSSARHTSFIHGGEGAASTDTPPPGPSASSPSMMPRHSSFMHGGIGSAGRHQADAQAEQSMHPTDQEHAFPPSFAQPPKERRRGNAFQGRQAAASTASTKSADLAPEDMRHLQSISSSFGARLLAKQGWVAGKGLGLQEDGKAVPIEANKNIVGRQGIGKGVRTEQSKREARERGERFSSDEEGEKRKSRKGKNKQKRQDGEQQPGLAEEANWKKNKKVKIKVEHKTYDQLLAEAGQAGSYSGVGPILDARSGELKEVSSLSNLALSSWTPSSDKTRLPELRHNLRLILDVTKGDVLALAKEGKGVKEKREWSTRELARLQKLQVQEEIKITQLKAVQQTVQVIQEKVQMSRKIGVDPLDDLAVEFNSLLSDYREQYDEYDLDEVVVGAIAQLLKDAFRRWDPLDDPDGSLLQQLQTWRKAYRYSEAEQVQSSAVGLFGDVPSTNGSARGGCASLTMTPFEAMLNTLWLPKVRSAINNDWDPQQPQPAVLLVELWSPILPRFMRDNVIDQLVLPKLHKKVRDWSPRHQKPGSAQSLAAVIFPWLPILGSRAEELLDEAKIRLGEVMKKWNVRDAIPEEFGLWREMISRGKWDTLILLNILPKLAANLESDFEVNPRSQDLVPLNRALAWSGLIRESTFAQLLEERFFPKWLDTLHFWLIQPNYNASEVASWYHYWKDLLSQHRSIKQRNLDDIEGIEHGLRYGLRLMNDAMALGDDAPQRLAKPDFKPLPVKSSANGKDKQSKSNRRAKPSTTEQHDITFRAIAEQHAADHNLIFVPTGVSHLGTGKPLFKVSKSVDGRGGVTVYVGEDAVYAMMQDGVFRAVLLDDMVKMAGA